MNVSIKKIGAISGPTIFFLVLLFFHPDGLSKEANAILASTLWVAIWWITEAIPIAATSLLPIVLFPLSGGLDIKTTTAAFGNHNVFLYAGGFILAIGIERWNLHKRIALSIINVIGTNVKTMILGFMIATAFLSMWISNTATSVMMLPIGIAIITQLTDNPNTIEDENKIFGKALMLAIAYSASIGGVASLIGTPTNLILAGIVKEIYDFEITFTNWIVIGLPISVVMLFICWRYLVQIAFSFKQKEFPGGKNEVKRQLKELGKISFEEKLVLAVFIFTAFAWITRSFLLQPIFSAIDDTIIAITAALLLFLLPSREKGKPLMNWKTAVKLPWGVLLLFGGGLALAAGFKESGLAVWIGTQMTLLQGVYLITLLAFIVTAVNFLTEITSNVATTSMLLPVLASMALSLDVHPFILMVGATIAASCAFMLPVATPPNAVVFGSGYLTIPDMMKKGFWLNIISIILIIVITYYLLPYFWNFDPSFFPQEFK
ncbi:sodium-dependent dicarboxylate transporter 2/3/5 [Aquimarina sp. MAR_2010_214]|uniref:SLC13 family permease n=1 Tax=Aquimarina sp. MAR_2010_214 TaxID=1250026 RepID=UPI000C704567|nr:DASS family sodium-coupled anion symporter [Aquimarina sp. MAR_2010_214]PKV50402.1 sodium-dependent dicarboxylate transporter 2/3/5 [Aquimarina sp. MAR_2010_214]